MADISKKTIAVLLVLAIVLSAIGTWQFLNKNTEVRTISSAGTAEVRVEISGEAPQPATTQGVVKVKID